MSGIQMRVTAAAAMLGAAALSVALGLSMSSADEPKRPTPSDQPRLDTPVLPMLHLGGGVFDSADLRKAQDQMFRALEALTKDPNDAEARKLMVEAQQAMMETLGGGIALPGPGFTPGRVAERGRLGIRLERVTPLVADQLGLESGKGVAVGGVREGSAAEKAGFKVHDIVVEFAGKPVTDPADFVRQVSAVKVGEKVDAVVLRKGKRVELKGIDLPAPEADAGELPPNPNALDKALPNARGVNSVSVSVSGENFTINAMQDGVSYLVTGKVGAAGASAEKVSIKANSETIEAQEVAKIPEKYRSTVEKLLKLVGKPRGKVRD